MTDFVKALQTKIAELQEEKDSLEESLLQVNTKLDLLLELIGEETASSNVKGKRKPGRPVGSKKRSKSDPPKSKQVSPEEEELFREANASLEARGGATPPDLAERRVKSFAPMARTPANYGSEVKIQTKAKIRKKLAGEDTED